MFLSLNRSLSKWFITVLLTLLVISLVIFSHQYKLVFDWTNNQKNSLTAATIAMLKTIKQPVLIESYTIKPTLKNQIKKLIARYQYHKKDIQLVFINPALQPDVIRKLGIQVEGELVIHLARRTEHLTDISEDKISNSLLKLSRQSLKVVYFIIGHGERSYEQQANFDLYQLSNILKRQGFIIKQSTILALENKITAQDVLVLADPKGQFFSAEIDSLIASLEKGVNLLWLIEPNSNNNNTELQALAEYLGIEIAEGVIVDPQTQVLKLQRPDFTIINDYLKQHPISKKLQQTTLFPQAVALDPLPENNDFKLKVFLLSSENSWLEKSPIKGKVGFDAEDDIQGPLILGLSLQRELQTSLDVNNNSTKSESDSFEQRIVIVGDADFISNQYLANGANLALGLNIFNWLSEDEQLISIASKFYPDQHIELSNQQLIAMGLVFLIIMPLLFFIIGIYISYKRKQKV